MAGTGDFNVPQGRQPAVFLGRYVGQELQHRVLLQPGEVVGLWRGQPRPGKVLLDDRRLPQGKALLLLDNQAGEGFRVLPYQLHQGADVLRLVGHAVEHLAVFVRGQLPV